MITQEYLKNHLHYDCISGKFTWISKVSVKANVKVGATAGSLGKRGYIQITLNKKQYVAHRLAFLYMLGYIPKTIDHIDNNGSNNSWSNLRECTQSQNVCNTRLHVNGTSTNIKGVYQDKHGYYHAQVTANGKRYRKIFREMYEAEDWLLITRKFLHKEFTNHGAYI